MRPMTEFTARRTPFWGSGDSAAAMVTISVPMKLNIVSRIPARTAENPLGRNPPASPVRENPGVPLTSLPGRTPKIASRPTTMNPTMATTLTPANQNSNSP